MISRRKPLFFFLLIVYYLCKVDNSFSQGKFGIADSTSSGSLKNKGNNSPSFINKFIPGLYQLKMGHEKRAIFFSGASLLSSLYFLSVLHDKPSLKIPGDYPYREENGIYYFRNYKITREVYENGIKELTKKLETDEYTYNRKKNTALTLLGGIYTANLVDAFILPFVSSRKDDEATAIKDKLNTVGFLYGNNEMNEAEKMLTDLLENHPLTDKDLETAYVFLASIYYSTERYAPARKIIENLLELNPNFLVNGIIPNTSIIEFTNEIREQKFTSVAILDVPNGTKVYIDGKLKSETPSRFIVKAGETYKFGFLASGYNLIEKDITVNSQPVFSMKVDLEENYETGSFIVNSDPPGAEIYVNNELKGITPHFIDNLRPGYYEVIIKKASREIEKKIYPVFGGESTVINTELKKFDDYLLLSEILPGLGQIKSGHKKHGFFFMGLSLGFLSYYYRATRDKPNVYYYSNDALKIEDGLYYWGDQQISREIYNQEVDKINLSVESKQRREEYENKKSRIQSLGVLIYVSNLVDTYFLVSKMKKNEITPEIGTLDYSLKPGFKRIDLVLSYRF